MPTRGGYHDVRARVGLEHNATTRSRSTIEAYLYFDLPDTASIVHIMGEPDETRHLIVRQ